MKLKKLVVLIMLLSAACVPYLFSDVSNPDKPLKGEWDFKLKKMWEIGEAGKDVLARPTHLLVSDEGTVYLFDKKNLKYYIFSADGKFKKSFGPRGEGPGEIKIFRNACLVDNKLIVVDLDNLHYFDKDGTYLKSVKNMWRQKQADYFFNENEFIHFPKVMGQSKEATRDIAHYNIKTGENKVIKKYSIYMGSVSKNPDGTIDFSVMIPGISPFMVLGGYSKDRFYYGFNNSYKIHAADYNGKSLFNFSLERQKEKIDTKGKREFFKKNPPPAPRQLPEDIINGIIKSLPNELTYFSRIEIHHKLIYVHVSYLNRQPEKQQLDIFTPEGKYFYRGFIHAPKDSYIISGPYPVLTIKDDHLYVVLEEKGETILAKYSLTMPTL